MKKYISVLLFLVLLNFYGFGQQVDIQLIKPSFQVQESLIALQSSLDSANKISRVPLYAKFFKQALGPQDAQIEQSNYYWKIPSNDFAIRVYLRPQIQPADSLFIYNIEGELLEKLGGTLDHSEYWISPPSANGTILHFKSPSYHEPRINMIGYSLEALNSSHKDALDFGDSDPCEVNIACPEGDNYRDVEKSVVRINVKLGAFEGWCTGTLINNTAQDFKPYILTNEHCGIIGGSFVDSGDLSKWEFFFNYQSLGCSNPSSESELNFTRITGSELLARSDDNGGDFGSDFALLNLTDTSSFKALANPYFAGWNRANTAPASGVSIHHPEGDIKKISTFSRSESSEFGGSVSHTHWKVWWDATVTNHGVTEPGSSGGPLFDAQGLFVGGLTGGSASCSNNSAPDWYGKFSYSWDQNGSTENRKLEPWLDPVNSGAFVLGGAYRGDSIISGPDEGEIELAPNPTSDGLVFLWNMGTQEIADVFVFDYSGKLVYSKLNVTGLPINLGRPKLDLQRLNNGLYIIRIEQGGKANEFFKLRIQR